MFKSGVLQIQIFPLQNFESGVTLKHFFQWTFLMLLHSRFKILQSKNSDLEYSRFKILQWKSSNLEWYLWSALTPLILKLQKIYLHQNWSEFRQKSNGMVKFINFIGGLISKTVVSTSSITGEFFSNCTLLEASNGGQDWPRRRGTWKGPRRSSAYTCSIPLENGFTLLSWTQEDRRRQQHGL